MGAEEYSHCLDVTHATYQVKVPTIKNPQVGRYAVRCAMGRWPRRYFSASRVCVAPDARARRARRCGWRIPDREPAAQAANRGLARQLCLSDGWMVIGDYLTPRNCGRCASAAIVLGSRKRPISGGVKILLRLRGNLNPLNPFP